MGRWVAYREDAGRENDFVGLAGVVGVDLLRVHVPLRFVHLLPDLSQHLTRVRPPAMCWLQDSVARSVLESNGTHHSKARKHRTRQHEPERGHTVEELIGFDVGVLVEWPLVGVAWGEDRERECAELGDRG